MTWDLYAIVIMVVISGVVLCAVPLLHLAKRAIQWHRLRQYRHGYVPHSHSGVPWRENKRV